MMESPMQASIIVSVIYLFFYIWLLLVSIKGTSDRLYWNQPYDVNTTCIFQVHQIDISVNL